MNLPNLIPGEALIYERVDGVVYARYRDPPYNEMYERWIIGGDSEGINRAEGNLFSYSEWNDMMRLALTNPVLKKQMQKLLNLYYIVKDNK